MWILIALALVFALAGSAMVAWAVWGETLMRRRRLADTIAQVDGPQDAVEETEAIGVDDLDRAETITRLIESRPWSETLQLELLRAGWVIRPSEFVAYTALAALVLASFAMVIYHSVPMGLGAAPVACAASWMLLKSRQSRRNAALSAQLPEALDMLASSVRAGFSLAQAMKRVQGQTQPPFADELSRALEEVQLGRSLAESLDGITTRTANYDLTLLVSATQAQLETGGNMAEILDKIATMIRERVKLQGEIAVSTAEGRLSTGILLGLPVGMILLLRMTNPTYLLPLVQTAEGRVIALAAAAMMVTGAMILRRLTCIRV